ncbi:MAG: hypothetical protein ACYDIC_09475 [Desulfobaccales bacterium]
MKELLGTLTPEPRIHPQITKMLVGRASVPALATGGQGRPPHRLLQVY